MFKSCPSAGSTVLVPCVAYFGTLNIASRFLPKLMVLSSVPTKIRLRPLTAASRQPFPLVIRSPLRAFSPLIVISPAMRELLSSEFARRYQHTSVGLFRGPAQDYTAVNRYLSYYLLVAAGENLGRCVA